MANNITPKDKEKEREFLVECIELYRSLPALWQVKSKQYHDRVKKNTAYKILLEKYNKMYPFATKEDLKKKINSLRTNYRKELKKHVNSIKSSSSGDSVYQPTLWYFEEMNFLRDQEITSDYSVDVQINSTAHGDEDHEEDVPETRASFHVIRDATLSETDSTLNEYSPRTASHKKPKKNKALSESLINVPYERISEVKDEYHHWGIVCAADLRNMERTQQIYAKKAIAEILMEGQLGMLHRNSVKINENTQYNSTVKLSSSPQYSNCASSPSYSNPIP